MGSRLGLLEAALGLIWAVWGLSMGVLLGLGGGGG